MINILLTCAGSELSPLISQKIKEIKKFKNIQVIGVDQKDQLVNKYFFDYFYKVSKNKKKYLNQIISISKKRKINLILPGSDEEALILSSNRERIEKRNLKIACSDTKHIKTFSNKIWTLKILEKNKINVGKWDVVNNKDELIKKVKNFFKKNATVVIKPSISRGGRNVFIISKRSHRVSFNPNGREITLGLSQFQKGYLKKIKNLYPFIIMEKLCQPTYDFDMLCSKGRLINGISRRRLVPSMPNEGHLIEKVSKIYAIGEKVAKIFNLTWLYDCDFMVDKKKNPILIEVNPRMSGSAIVSSYAGFNLFENLISLYKKKKIKKFDIKGKKIIVPYKQLYNAK